MRSTFIFSWALLFDASRSAGVLMTLQGVMCLLFSHTVQLMAWGRGSVLIGLLFWAAWAISKPLGLDKDRDMHDASFKISPRSLAPFHLAVQCLMPSSIFVPICVPFKNNT